MRIAQIIDSLEPGGAERMAVNYANALSKTIEFSGLIATRKEGLLLNQIDEKVSYLLLKKKKSIDFKAVFRLRKYLKNNKIDIIHAHSSSFFIAVLVKFTLPKIKIIWHDHYGISQDLVSRKNISLKLGSIFFTGIISVNTALKTWAESYLFCANIIYFPNFIDKPLNSDKKLLLYGLEGKRIICVANLRQQKNHELLLNAAVLIRDKFPDWTFHLFGKDFRDSYSEKLNSMVMDLKLRETVFFYGAVNNVGAALKQCNIAVLASFSEGLPLAVLEYGLYKLPVIATNVGEISKVITSEKEGVIIESNNIKQLVESIQNLIENERERQEIGIELSKRIMLNYSQEAIIEEYLSWINSLTNFVFLKAIKN
ncbi:glycosyltransferase family 4 protein [Flavobacterium sp. MC2016-06]|jgi:glycosyltransferase involved in cell wall biosynthesis|uniref:glycosyltransferase family 4 protein n=1 Tax=Flavobacterium sp. MC2016-06 TaxID=2676308 RepID=UPI0012BAE4AF|nr:glycosyltransferase family 4 protein [Flavobacterium sp. MC2016-06]MBU3858685.1 glycosyltransferase family 4 protein [Flavobacterium sp. MC2016-06]